MAGFARPHQRPLRVLQELEEKRPSLETCAFCPKLCRGACPVTDAVPRETLTPWGKMSSAYLTALGDAPLEASYVSASYACTGCFGCKESCDHRNDVTSSLFATRGAYVQRDVAPKEANDVVAGFSEHDERTREAAARFTTRTATDASFDVLVGCGYVLKLEEETNDALRVVKKLVRRAPRIADGCCGLPLLHAGEKVRFRDHVRRFVERLNGRPLLAVDPGCAVALKVHAPAAGIRPPTIVPLVEEAAKSLSHFRKVEAPPLRYHDACQLSRGLGLMGEPRALLERITGKVPLEFRFNRERGRCSGAGGLVPRTLPAVAKGMSAARLLEVQEGERVVTSCASSLRHFRKTHEADDLVTWMARAIT